MCANKNCLRDGVPTARARYDWVRPGTTGVQARARGSDTSPPRRHVATAQVRIAASPTSTTASRMQRARTWASTVALRTRARCWLRMCLLRAAAACALRARAVPHARTSCYHARVRLAPGVVPAVCPTDACAWLALDLTTIGNGVLNAMRWGERLKPLGYSSTAWQNWTVEQMGQSLPGRRQRSNAGRGAGGA